MAPEAHSPPALRRAERQRFAEAFEAFKAPNAKEGLSVGGFVKLCQRCFRFSDTFGANEAEEIFWEVVLPGGEMDLQGLDTALSLIAWRFGRAAGALKRAVSLAGVSEGKNLPALANKEMPRHNVRPWVGGA
ncbi:unnamed protein product [Durusdinium trenchii]